MDDMTRLQQRWIEAARRHHAPSASAVRRMRRGLRARIEAGELAPSVRPEPEEARISEPGMRPWLWGAGVLLAAAALLLWANRGTRSQLGRAPEPSAAGYDANARDAGRARTSAHATPRTSAEPTHEATAPVDAASPDAPASRPRAPTLGHPPPAPETKARAAPLEPSPSTEASAGLDVAGEAAVLRRAKADIERREWARAAAALLEYERSYPGGVLAPEARALGVLLACHQRAPDAAARADEFLRRYPTSPLRDRIRDACTMERDR